MNKKELTFKCREILYKKNITKEDEMFLKKLLKTHPYSKQKIGIGIKNFFINRTIYGTMGFNIIRLDETTTDFSFIECISPKSKIIKIKYACRSAIRKLIKNYKTDNSKVIHHEKITFNKIVDMWLKENKEIDLTLNKNIDDCQIIYFISEDTINSFIKFHKKNATLIELSIKEHKLKHKKFIGVNNGKK